MAVDATLRELAQLRAELTQAREDNAGLLSILRELDLAHNPDRAQRLLDHARDAPHPGRALMARTLADLTAARAVIAAARLACARSLFPGRGVLMAAIGAYEDAVKAREGR